ncbi:MULTISPECIES: protein phosphatase 2C domain-containing protein [unclassified Mesorhizobium]|uniref:PP2C family protein-serine/threonine phosphatase n=1 Tax=unclassified Mesorhizobium TaxID=325217 RepID=UPI00112A2B06|nr:MULTISPECIES: protein phosphatase 2C domain-containing protein [unclassified Mesorhizobium]TPK89839.1 hypothetical protein FJ567_30095 [Mesorhizobium sp. B2-4-16]TPL57342.1 hypothetical protein FJ956_30300 [Mesorhizobium sp. B2-4-3]
MSDTVMFAALADGVGGRPDGRWASHTALSALVSDDFTQNSTATLAVAIAKANRALSGRAASGNGPATTLAGLALNRDGLNVFHVGDSRVYEIGRTAVKMLTHDHRSRADGRSITRYLGSDAHAIPAISAIGPPVAATYLISTDGFHGFLRDTDLLLLTELDRASALSALFDMALENGSNDNLSAVVVVVE